jgi:hypothetical protein
VVEAAPAVTFTLGGLLIGPDARVRAREGGTVPGPAGRRGGRWRYYVRAYAGGLANAVVFGVGAARTALSDTVKEAVSQGEP